MTVASGGAISKKDGADITFTPLLTTSDQSEVFPVEKVEGNPDPAKLLASFKPDGKRRVIAAPELELLAPAQLNIVCFRYRCENADAVNRAIVADLHEAGVVAPSLTRIDGAVAIRAALFNHRTDARDIEALIDGAIAFGRARTRGGAA